MRILDAHVHYNGNAAQAERFIAAWRAGGVEKAVVFATNANDGSHPSVAEVAALAERFPDFFIPFGYINPGQPGCRKVVRDAASRSFKGLKFIYPLKPYDDDEYFPIYEAAAKAGMVCLFHTGIVIGTSRKGTTPHGTDFQRTWRVSSNYMRPASIDRICRVFPEMTIIGAHIGAAAWYEEATEMMHWNANLYFDLSIGQLSYTRRNAKPGKEPRAIRPRIQELYDTGQLDLNRILFGSDGVVGVEAPNPAWALNTVRFELDAIGATEAEKEAVRWGTAAKILGIE